MAIPRRTEKMSPVTPPRTPSTVRDISLDLGSKESLSQNIRQPNMTQIGSLPAHLAASKEELSGVPDEHGHVHGPQCGDTTHDEASDWEDTDEERERPAATDEDDNDPRGPRWTWELPTRKQVRKAADLNLYDEWGNAIPFKDLLPPTPPRNSNKEATNQPPFRRLVVFFIGHWWCGLCHDYALMSVARLSQAALIREGVRVALVSSGTWKAIAKYRATLEIPFPVYVDRGTRLFASLGMATSFPNPFAEAMIKERPKYHRHAFARQMATGLAVRPNCVQRGSC